jgi:ATP-dependent Clp protease protease subunit
MVAVLLTLHSEDSTAGVQMYFNCPGGEVRAGLAVFDTMNNCGFEVTTLNLGIAASISGFLCGAGTKGKRMALPNARFLLQVLSSAHALIDPCRTMCLHPHLTACLFLQNPKLEDMGLSQVLYGQASDVKIEATEILRMREKVYRGLMQFTDRDYETIRKDLTRDLYLTAPEAVEYGLIDKVLLPLERDESDYKKYIGDPNAAKNFGRI